MAFFVFVIVDRVGKGWLLSHVERFWNKKAFSVVVCSLLYKTYRFHVAVRLFSNRSQKTSTCGKNISDTLGYRLVCHFFCSYHILTSSVIYYWTDARQHGIYLLIRSIFWLGTVHYLRGWRGRKIRNNFFSFLLCPSWYHFKILEPGQWKLYCIEDDWKLTQ